MRTVARWIHGFSILEQIALKVKNAFDEDGNLIDEELQSSGCLLTVLLTVFKN